MAMMSLPDDLYKALLDAAEERGTTPQEVIASGLEALADDRKPVDDHPLTAEEFAASLGMTDEEVAAADAEARRRYPEIYA